MVPGGLPSRPCSPSCTRGPTHSPSMPPGEGIHPVLQGFPARPTVGGHHLGHGADRTSRDVRIRPRALTESASTPDWQCHRLAVGQKLQYPVVLMHQNGDVLHAEFGGPELLLSSALD